MIRTGLWMSAVRRAGSHHRRGSMFGMGASIGVVHRRAVLAARGISEAGLAEVVEAGRLRRIAQGGYTPEPRGQRWEEYRREVLACALRGGAGSAVISHQSAGSLHALPMLKPSMSRVHVSIGTRSGGGVRSRRHIHPRPLPPADVVTLDGIRVTSRARTAIDIATGGDFERALTVVDGVRRVWRYPAAENPAPVPLAALQACLATLRTCRGTVTARRALAASVCRSESVGESWSRARMIEWGLPAPRLQVGYVLGGREYFTDFTWGSLIGEFDGMDKYADPEVIAYEKRRDSDFRAAGYSIFHWRWSDLEDRARFFRILTSEMLKGGVLDRQPPFGG